jgi:hypothetical protein
VEYHVAGGVRRMDMHDVGTLATLPEPPNP